MAAVNNSAAEMTKIGQWITSGDPENWKRAVNSPLATHRQICYVARRLAELHEADDEVKAAECAKILLAHNFADKLVAKLVLDSLYPSVWLEVLRSHHVDEALAKQIYSKNEAKIRKLMCKKGHEQTADWRLTLQIRDELSAQAATDAEALDKLAHTDGTKYWLKVASSKKVGQKTLQYIVQRLQVEPDPYEDLDKLVNILLNREGLSEGLRRDVTEIQEYAQLARLAQNQQLQEMELVEIAKKLAATSVHHRQVCDAALALSWHNNTTARVMQELARSTQSMAMFCVAQAEVTDAPTLMTVAANVHLMQYRNPNVYWATVTEIIRHPNLTDAVVKALVETIDSMRVYNAATFAICAERDTLQFIIDRAFLADQKSYGKLQNDLLGVIAQVILHPHSDFELRKYIVRRANNHRRDGHRLYAFHGLGGLLNSIDRGEIDWDGYRIASYFPHRDWVANMTAWQGLASEPLDGELGITFPRTMREALQSEYLTEYYLDKIVQIFALQRRSPWWDDDLRHTQNRGPIIAALQELYNSPFLTANSRDVLLSMEGPVGDELRKIAKQGAAVV